MPNFALGWFVSDVISRCAAILIYSQMQCYLDQQNILYSDVGVKNGEIKVNPGNVTLEVLLQCH